MAVTLDQIKGLLEQAIRETVQQMSTSPSRAPRERRYRPRLKDDGMGRGRGGRSQGQWGDNGGALAEDEEAIYWQTRYEELKASTQGDAVSPAVQELGRDLRQAQQREDAAEEACRKLERKIERLQSPNTSRRALQEVLTDRVEDRRLTLEFMEWLTSTSVRYSVAEGGNDDFVCTVKNPREKRVTRFSIVAGAEAHASPGSAAAAVAGDGRSGRSRKIASGATAAGGEGSDAMDEEDTEGGGGGDSNSSSIYSSRRPQISYEPKANIEQLPDYLRQTIKFDPDMAPVLLLDVLNAMYGDGEDEEAEMPAAGAQFRGTGVGLGETEER